MVGLPRGRVEAVALARLAGLGKKRDTAGGGGTRICSPRRRLASEASAAPTASAQTPEPRAVGQGEGAGLLLKRGAAGLLWLQHPGLWYGTPSKSWAALVRGQSFRPWKGYSGLVGGVDRAVGLSGPQSLPPSLPLAAWCLASRNGRRV